MTSERATSKTHPPNRIALLHSPDDEAAHARAAARAHTTCDRRMSNDSPTRGLPAIQSRDCREEYCWVYFRCAGRYAHSESRIEVGSGRVN